MLCHMVWHGKKKGTLCWVGTVYYGKMGSGVVLCDVVWHGMAYMAWWSVLVWYSRNVVLCCSLVWCDVICHGLVWWFCCAWILEPWGQLCKNFCRGMACHPLYLLNKYFNFSTFTLYRSSCKLAFHLWQAVHRSLDQPNSLTSPLRRETPRY